MIYDITPILSSDIAVYPGDLPLKITSVSNVDCDGVNVSQFEGTVHLGAHIDAPFHYFKNGAKVDALNLDLLVGKCQLIQIDLKMGEEILPIHLPTLEANINRLLICAHSHWDFRNINSSFSPLSPLLADYLVQAGIKLIGIDSPSVDAFSSTNYPVHKTFLSKGIPIMENLYLKDVPVGVYELIALPLKLANCEAAPLRAIVRDL